VLGRNFEMKEMAGSTTGRPSMKRGGGRGVFIKTAAGEARHTGSRYTQV